ncbi:anti-sigma factor antagonist [candidate division KSB3 bacterium]|uniref:Anti-sigma factor antagonist n=1 Tax=candidate division KSB3 bacterium TaxID=2044937 RepID=A0A9D5JTU5_9BACT|nr:anti-sigma factor antagonist [candidate division KSB3 bacterium]MBD3324107.1 anti-sigma factor antagonist [candidate division KSB3 bacterium]
MNTRKLDMHIQKVGAQADIAVVQIHGPLDTVAAYAFQEKMDDLIRSGIYKFIINLEQLEYISSAGIGVFPGMFQTLQEHQGGLVFLHVSPKVYKLFEMIGLTSIFQMKETLDEAIQEFEPQ